ncbi:MAG TPA: L-2-hydroxyglutarate oxidase [Intrasporangium sp.]|uniref:L-2-hydroxyglutarate oxidase n=1 Tax=Intrasporangium sp. TaxID=1925024 RepID=UPI002D777FFD|nr:L-2-hydroxyglutarate oxidase [Intrasporangium sp.]HET7397713.1 L-2-hydroxyglutarate oxidase [Intrasporangium sp.]
MSPERIAVIGAGIVGASIARALVRTHPGVEVTILEKEQVPGRHQTSRNSGVVHAGLYYLPGSAKARLSRRGVALLRDYCAEKGLPYLEVGKLLIALDEPEEARLRVIAERSSANGVPSVRWLSGAELTEVEPHVRGRCGLHSPTTAIVDFGRVAGSMVDDAVSDGARLLTGFAVTGIDVGRTTRITAASGDEVEADRVIIAAGLHADRLAALAGDTAYPRIVPFRGEYHQLAPAARHLVKGLIYPVPDPRYPFLGVHLTRRVDGSVLIGPNAVLALAREGYTKGVIDVRELRGLISDKAFREFARRNLRTGAAETWGSLGRRAFLNGARRYVPEIRAADIQPAPAGVRAQALDADGALVEDFRFTRVGNVFCIRNAPSPAATASLAIADMVVHELGLPLLLD